MEIQQRREYARAATRYISDDDRLKYIKSVTDDPKEIDNILRMARWYDKEDLWK